MRHLYGGLDIKNGFLTDNHRTRLVTQRNPEIGDVTVAEYDEIYEVFLYLGDGKLVKVSSTNGICKLLTGEAEPYSSANILVTFLAYGRFAVLWAGLVG